MDCGCSYPNYILCHEVNLMSTKNSSIEHVYGKCSCCKGSGILYSAYCTCCKASSTISTSMTSTLMAESFNCFSLLYSLVALLHSSPSKRDANDLLGLWMLDMARRRYLWRYLAKCSPLKSYKEWNIYGVKCRELLSSHC